jgi:arylsulfatase A-like enzyme
MRNNKLLNRRDFLKIAGTTALASTLPAISLAPSRAASPGEMNIIILVYDAFSARNIPLYGYDRNTTPNINRFAQQATVFHQHYAAGNFTFPGTSSMLTGTYPWTHRGFNPDNGIDPKFETQNIFQLFDQHHRVSYTHNAVAYNLLRQLQQSIDRLKPRQDLYLDRDFVSDLLFAYDEDTATISWWQSIVKKGRKGTYSLFFSHFYRAYKERILNRYAGLYPRGLPNIRDDNFFLPEDASDWAMEDIGKLLLQPQPFLGYYHFLPPHDPFLTRADFVDTFLNDGYEPIKKPHHIFSRGRSHAELAHTRRMYDEYCLLADHEFGRIFNHLTEIGALENTIVVLTSDHGEMFERGIEKHYHETLHQPVIQIPLLIFLPGQTERHDIYSSTSNVDLLPTLLHLTGRPIPSWIEGMVLPPYSNQNTDPQRAVYAVEAKESPQYGLINPASLMIVKNGYKLTYYTGWKRQKENDPSIELYAVQDDPEETNDLAKQMPSLRDEMLEEVIDRAEQASQKAGDGE